MSENRDILEFFHEDTTDERREQIRQSLSETDLRDLAQMQHIWSESSELEETFAFDASKAFDALPLDEAPVKKARIVSMRRVAVAVAAAAVIVLVVTSRFLVQEPVVIDHKTFATLEEAEALSLIHI